MLSKLKQQKSVTGLTLCAYSAQLLAGAAEALQEQGTHNKFQEELREFAPPEEGMILSVKNAQQFFQ